MDDLTTEDGARPAHEDAPPREPGAEPDAPAAARAALAWRVGGASVRGTGHVAAGLPCQDAHAVAVTRDAQEREWLVAVVSDGAGSARHADTASRAACDFVLARVEYLLCSDGADPRDLDAVGLVRDAAAHLAALAEDAGSSAREYACTLLLALAGRDACLFVQVGDGVIVHDDADGRLRAAFWPDGGEYANETHFITDAPPSHVHVRLVPYAVRHVALLSDGLQMLCLNYGARTVHAPFFAPFFQALATNERAAFEHALANTLSGPRVSARTDDDKTFLLALRA